MNPLQSISIENSQSQANSAISAKNAPIAGLSQKKILRRKVFMASYSSDSQSASLVSG